MNNVLLFGGTFNPVHNGHIYIVRECMKRININKLFVVPANIPPHKRNLTDMVSGMHRFNMCKLAFEQDNNVEVSDFEIKKQGISYTVDTLVYFSKIFSSSKINLLIGSDMLYTFKTWREYKKILSMADLIVVPRDLGFIFKIKNDIMGYMKEYKNNIKVLNIKLLEISSTKIRENIIKNKSIENLVPNKVISYIKENNLYM